MQLELFIWIYRFSVWNQVLVACVFLSLPYFAWLCFVLYSDQELFWLHHQQVAMSIGVFHLPILVIAKSLLIENLKELKTPVTNELGIGAEPWGEDAGVCSSLPLTTESNPSNWSCTVNLEHFIRTTSTAWRGMESVGSWCYNVELWCLLSKNLWVLEQKAWKPVTGSYSRSCLDYPASICSVLCHDYARVKRLYVF